MQYKAMVHAFSMYYIKDFYVTNGVPYRYGCLAPNQALDPLRCHIPYAEWCIPRPLHVMITTRDGCMHALLVPHEEPFNS